MVADPAALEQVLFGPDGASETIAPDAILIDMSTVGPTAIPAPPRRSSRPRCWTLPSSAASPTQRRGRSRSWWAAIRASWTDAPGVLGALGTVRHVGRLGAGATVKLAANAANMSTMVCLGEVLALTDRDGLEPEVVLDALGLGPLGSFVDRFRDKVLGRVESVDFRLALARKDLALALDQGEADGLDLTIPSSAMARCDEAIGAGRADQDNTSVIPHIREGLG